MRMLKENTRNEFQGQRNVTTDMQKMHALAPRFHFVAPVMFACSIFVGNYPHAKHLKGTTSVRQKTRQKQVSIAEKTFHATSCEDSEWAATMRNTGPLSSKPLKTMINAKMQHEFHEYLVHGGACNGNIVTRNKNMKLWVGSNH